MSETGIIELQTKFDVNRKDFLQFCEIIGAMTEEATIKLITDLSCPSYGLSCTSMDPSHVGLIKVFLGLNVKYKELHSGKQFAVMIDEIKKVVKTMKEDTISVELDRGKALGKAKGTVKIFSDTQSTELHMIEETFRNGGEDVPMPKIKWSYKGTFDTKEFLAMLRSVENVSDYITFTVTDDGISYSGKGVSGKTSGSLKGEKCTEPSIVTSKKIEGTYSLEYLLPILRVMKDGNVILALGEGNKPCKIRYLNTDKIDTDWNKQFERVKTIDFYLAPRVES